MTCASYEFLTDPNQDVHGAREEEVLQYRLYFRLVHPLFKYI